MHIYIYIIYITTAAVISSIFTDFTTMTSLTHPTNSEKGQMNRAHDQLTYILKEAPNKMGKILDEYYSDGKITVSFIKTLQLHIDICVKRQDFEQAQKLMSIYQAIEVRAKKNAEVLKMIKFNWQRNN